jgi:dissimilatory sulfite reductase related protein
LIKIFSYTGFQFFTAHKNFKPLAGKGVSITRILIMPIVEIDNLQLEFDDHGFLTKPDGWNERVAKAIARLDGIEELTYDHWAILKVIRENYLTSGKAPMIRVLCSETGLRLRDIYTLFPEGPARGACRIAGLPKPDGCI